MVQRLPATSPKILDTIIIYLVYHSWESYPYMISYFLWFSLLFSNEIVCFEQHYYFLSLSHFCSI